MYALNKLIHDAVELVCSLHDRISEGYTVTLELTGADCSRTEKPKKKRPAESPNQQQLF